MALGNGTHKLPIKTDIRPSTGEDVGDRSRHVRSLFTTGENGVGRVSVLFL
jgi:hypothetical protein